MAGGGDKTEKATPKRREEARKKGQIARSQDLSGAMVLIGGLIALTIWGPHVMEKLGESMRQTIGMMSNPRAVTASMLGTVAVESGETIPLTRRPLAPPPLGAGPPRHLGP